MKPYELISIVCIMILRGCSSVQLSSEYDYDEYNEVAVGRSEADDYDEYYGDYLEKAVTSIPEFLSQSTNLAVDSGETFSLPCYVTRMDDYVLMWMKDDEIISLGNQILKSDGDRYTLEVSEQGNKLVVKYATTSDRGTYYCQVSSYNLANIYHTVTVRAQPVIETYPKGPISLKEGDSVQLFCYLVAGEPQPEVWWMIRNAENDTEHLEQQLDLTNVSRQHTGQYICLADNGFGLKHVSAEVAVTVEYMPEIDIQQVYLASADKSHIYISCIVDSSPRARVSWAKDGQSILPGWPGSDQYSVSVDGATHNLILQTITSDSFGVYSCFAENSVGVAQASTHVSDLGCWSTHQTEHLSSTELKTLSASGHIQGGDIQYGIVCTKPFVELHNQQEQNEADEADANDNIKVDNIQTVSSSNSEQNIDQSVKKESIVSSTKSLVMEAIAPEIHSNHKATHKDKVMSTSVYSHESIDSNDVVKVKILDVDNTNSLDGVNTQVGTYPDLFKPEQENKDNSQILSTESRTETVDILLPSNHLETLEVVVYQYENKSGSGHEMDSVFHVSHNSKEATLLSESDESIMHVVNDSKVHLYEDRNLHIVRNLEENDAKNMTDMKTNTNEETRSTTSPERNIIVSNNREDPEFRNAVDSLIGLFTNEGKVVNDKLDKEVNESEAYTHYGKAEIARHDATDATHSNKNTLNTIKTETDYKKDDTNVNENNEKFADRLPDAANITEDVDHDVSSEINASKTDVMNQNGSEVIEPDINNVDSNKMMPKEEQLEIPLNDNLNQTNTDITEDSKVDQKEEQQIKISRENETSEDNKLGDTENKVIKETIDIVNETTEEENMGNISLQEGDTEDKSKERYIEDVPEVGNESVSKYASRTKPNITYTINTADNKQEESVTSIRQLIENYKSAKFEDCELWPNIVIENANTIKMTVRETARDCHMDCQVTEGCLGWFFGGVGGLHSCVLYGCGQFKQLYQPNTVSCRIGDCIGGWMDELYSCKFKAYYSYVGEERFERIVQAHGRANRVPCELLTFLLLWISLFVFRL